LRIRHVPVFAQNFYNIKKEEGTGEYRELLANFLKGASYSGRRYFS
jgi:hypothetical protein